MKKIIWFAAELRPRGRIGKKPVYAQKEALQKWLIEEQPWTQYLCRKYFQNNSGSVLMVVSGFGEAFATYTIHPNEKITDLRELEQGELIEQPSEDRTSAIYTRSEIDSCTDFRELEIRPQKLEADRTIGDGNESVYVYTTILEREMNRVKVGRASGDPLNRITDQFGSSNSSGPVWMLDIRTDDSVKLEGALHKILKEKELHIKEQGGTEWFKATAEDIEKEYNNLAKELNRFSTL